MFSRIRAYLHGMVHRSKIDAEVDDELRFHLEMSTQANIERGMAPDEAQRVARLNLGGSTQVQERVRDLRTTFLDALCMDVRFALRAFRRNPGFTTVAVITLALGIGANTAIFTLIDAVLFRPLSFGDPSRLVWIAGYDERAGTLATTISAQAHAEIAGHRRNFDAVTCSSWTGPSFTARQNERETLSSMEVCANFFDVLGVRPVLGRGFVPEDDASGDGAVAVLSYTAFQKRFGADPNIVGHAIVFKERVVRIVGVAPPDFFVAPLLSFDQPDMLVPGPQPSGRAPAVAVARLKGGSSIDQAQAEVDAVGRGLAASAGRPWRRNMRVVSLQAGLFDRIHTLSVVLVAAAGLVLLLAVVNLANLLLARGRWREQELAIRASLGASRWRLMRQLLVEGLLLSIGGGVIGLALAWVTFDALVASVPSPLFVALPTGVDRRVIVFTLGVSILTGLASAILPAVRLTDSDLNRAARDGRHGASGRRPARGAVLVVAQMAMVVVILTSAGLMLNSLVRALTVNLGMRVNQVVQIRSRPPSQAWKSAVAAEAYYRDITAQIGSVPGVTRVARICTLTVGGDQAPWASMLADGPPESRGVRYLVTADYFAVFGINVVSGRTFTEQEIQSAAPVAIVNATAARRLWPGERAVGKQFRTGAEPAREIIGVVADTRDSYRSPVRPSLFVPPGRDRPVSFDLVALVEGDPGPVAAAIRSRLRNPDARVETLSDTIRKTTVRERFQTLLLSLFAALALLLAAVGIAGIVGYTVARRTREIGTRLALGSSPRRIVALIICESLSLVAGGAIVGVCGALAVTRALGGLLFEVKPNDPMTFVVSVGALLFVGVLASLVPAFRAARVDPITTLKCE
jgi:putative ABC transport system permease protein